MMTCEFVQGELVAYRDGELPEQDREQIAAHLKTCAVCAYEEAQLARVEHFLVTMERITPSPDFAATFWKRLEQEQTAQVNISDREHRLVRWWREVRETMTAWHMAPALAAAASLLVFFAYFFTSSPTQRATETSAPTPAPVPQELVAAPVTTVPAGVPPEITEKLELYVNYKIISDLERFSHLEEIAAIELPTENATEIVQEDNLPPELLENPSFFAHYPILQQMDKLQNLEAVLDTPPTEGDSQGRG
jgi:hypothetical protein